jgi:carboxypeptidase C (cathepsin A)
MMEGRRSGIVRSSLTSLRAAACTGRDAMVRYITLLGMLLVALMPRSLSAGEEHAPPAAAPAAAPAVTHHSIEVNGKRLAYTATAGYLTLTDKEGKPQANIFFVAYTKDGDESVTRRPLAFAFNGGPGASSVWLHLGGIGPKRVPLAGDGTQLPVVDRLVDNEWTWLTFTDLVFIDPVGTGYSRAAPGVDASQFYNVPGDIDASGEFIRRYVTQYERWLSPKLVIGESYGTTRAAGLATRLPQAAGLDLAGVVLLSSALSFQTFFPEGGNDLPYPLALPTFTAVAAYHQRLPAAAPDLAQVEQWALTEYAAALAQGDRLPEAERSRLLDRLVQLTGLPRDYLEMSHLRVGAAQFTKELLRDQGRVVGLLDGRVAGVDTSALGEFPEYDPSLFLTTGPYVAVINDYLRRDLGFETTLRYEYLSRQVNREWKYASAGRGYLYVADDLAEAMTKDRRLRVFSGAGRYDLTTPYLSQQYTFDHMELDPSVRGRLTFKVYPSGHQLYTDLASLKELTADAAAFVDGTRAGR